MIAQKISLLIPPLIERGMKGKGCDGERESDNWREIERDINFWLYAIYERKENWTCTHAFQIILFRWASLRLDFQKFAVQLVKKKKLFNKSLSRSNEKNNLWTAGQPIWYSFMCSKKRCWMKWSLKYVQRKRTRRKREESWMAADYIEAARCSWKSLLSEFGIELICERKEYYLFYAMFQIQIRKSKMICICIAEHEILY